MVASKIDAANPDKLKKLKQWAKRKKLKLYPISAVTGEGIEKLKFAMAEEVEQLRKLDVPVTDRRLNCAAPPSICLIESSAAKCVFT